MLKKWESEFKSLSNPTANAINVLLSHGQPRKGVNNCIPLFEENFSVFEIKRIIDDAKRGKACGVDNISVDVLKNDCSVMFLHSFLIYVIIQVQYQIFGIKILLTLSQNQVVGMQGIHFLIEE